MKTFLLASFLTMVPVSAMALECYPSPVLITTQAQLDDVDDEPWCVSGHLTIAGNSIIDMHFDNLVSVSGNIYIIARKPPTNWSITFVSLQHAGMIKVGSSYRLKSIDLGMSVNEVASLKIYGNPHLNSIKLGSMYSLQNMEIYSNNTLSSLTSRDWEFAQEIEIYDNPVLSTCLVSDIVDYVTYDTATIDGNLVDGCYPWAP